MGEDGAWTAGLGMDTVAMAGIVQVRCVHMRWVGEGGAAGGEMMLTWHPSQVDAPRG